MKSFFRISIGLIVLLQALCVGTASAATGDQEFGLELPTCKKDLAAWKRYMVEGHKRHPADVVNLLWTDVDGDGLCDVVASMRPEFSSIYPEGKRTFPRIIKNYGCTFLYRNGKFGTVPPVQSTLYCSLAERALESAMPIYSKLARKTFLVSFEYASNMPALTVFGEVESKKFPHTKASVMAFYLRSLLRLQRDMVAAYPQPGSEVNLSQGQVAANMLQQEIDGVSGWKVGELLGLPEAQADQLVERIGQEVAAEPKGTGTGLPPRGRP
ncbi:MAG: hypothetical protein Q8R67_21465 [Rhodoferax sp.]|nr:hypothetical protein [Rhodoferax sp.]MDP3654247.1 hypothetical protein [Rhodoferax sp.]